MYILIAISVHADRNQCTTKKQKNNNNKNSTVVAMVDQGKSVLKKNEGVELMTAKDTSVIHP